MKILWANPHFLHPTTKGGQIRTLEMLRWLNRWHEVHYIALENPAEPEGMARSPEYCAHAYPIRHELPARRSLAFIAQAAGNLFSPMPLAVARYISAPMKKRVAELVTEHRFDAVVADFLFAAPNVPDLSRAVLFEHNVETTIWERHAANARNPLARVFFGQQARRMFDYERDACRAAEHVVTVSPQDSERIRARFGVDAVSDVPTGVDIEYFTPRGPAAPVADLVFVGSMDWIPNIDGMLWFADEIFPLIRQRRPAATVAIVGRKPPDKIRALAGRAGILVTGTVDDIRPYLWGSATAIVPLRIGGGTRLKIFECMAARTPVVSTAVGAEGLPVVSGEHCLLANSPRDFAARCCDLLDDAGARQRLSAAAYGLVSARFSWEHAARCFETAVARSAGVR